MAYFKTGRARAYTEEELTMAVVSVRDLGMSLYQAVKDFHVPKNVDKKLIHS